MCNDSRRRFLAHSAGAATALLAAGPLRPSLAPAVTTRGTKMAFGLVTYLWGKDWDLPTLLDIGDKTGTLVVELRATHAHGVEPILSRQERREVKKRFDDSPVTLVGLGSNERFDDPDPAVLNRAVEATKAFIKLSHDVGSGGVKVKPNSFHKDVPRRQTIQQIGRSLNRLGRFAADYGQQVRLEVHGQCAPLPIMRRIMDAADHTSVALCWNSNAQDLQGRGLVHNFDLVKDRFGATCHVRRLDSTDYPYQQLFGLLAQMDYAGSVLLEDSKLPKNPIAALIRQRELFDRMVAKAGTRA